MKYNRAEIMKRAWAIKKENNNNIFGACLKMAWAEAKSESSEFAKISISGMTGTEKQKAWQKKQG